MTLEALKDLQLGQRLYATHFLKRVGTVYKLMPLESHVFYCGWRTVNKGKYVIHDDGTYTEAYYNAKLYFTVALVVYHARRKPVYVRPENLYLEEPFFTIKES